MTNTDMEAVWLAAMRFAMKPEVQLRLPKTDFTAYVFTREPSSVVSQTVMVHREDYSSTMVTVHRLQSDSNFQRVRGRTCIGAWIEAGATVPPKMLEAVRESCVTVNTLFPEWGLVRDLQS